MKILVLLAVLGSFSAAASATVTEDCTVIASVRSVLQADARGRFRHVRVESYGGTIQLSGAVSTRAIGDLAVSKAMGVDGVNHVEDALELRTAQPVMAVD